MSGSPPSPVRNRPAFLRRIDWRPLVITAWALVLLWPIRQTGWLADDMFNASLPGLWIHDDVSPLGNAAREIRAWTFRLARINPGIHLWKNVAFWAFPDLYWYKWAQLAAAVAALLVFYACLKGMDADKDLAALACLLTAGLFQFRPLADPVFAFNGLMPLLLALTALSLLLLHRYRAGGGWIALIGSVLLYAAGALTYELTYPFFLLHGWVLCRSRAGWRRGALTLLPFVAAPVLLTLGSAYLRTRPDYLATSYAIKYDLPAMADTFAKQCAAALPCSYAGLDPTAPVHEVFAWGTFGHYGSATALALLLHGALAFRLIRRARQGGLGLGWWAALGLLLAVLPVPMLCLCAKYQGSLHYGFGYLPVFIEYFGVALLLACGVALLGRLPRRCPAWVLAPAAALPLAAFAVLDYAANAQAVNLYRVPLLSRRCEYEEVIDAGLLRGAPPGGFLVIDRAFLWEMIKPGDRYFYCCHTKTRLADVLAPSTDADALRKLFPHDPGDGPKPDMMRLRYANIAQPGTFAVAGKVLYARMDPDGHLRESGLTGVRLAVWRGEKWDPRRDRPFIFHTCCWRPFGDPNRVDPIDVPSTAMRRVRTTDHWSIYELDTAYPYLDGEAAWLEFPPPAAPVSPQNVRPFRAPDPVGAEARHGGGESPGPGAADHGLE